MKDAVEDEVVDHQISLEEEFESMKKELGWSIKQTYFYYHGPVAFAEKYGPKGE